MKFRHRSGPGLAALQSQHHGREAWCEEKADLALGRLHLFRGHSQTHTVDLQAIPRNRQIVCAANITEADARLCRVWWNFGEDRSDRGACDCYQTLVWTARSNRYFEIILSKDLQPLFSDPVILKWCCDETVWVHLKYILFYAKLA